MHRRIGGEGTERDAAGRGESESESESKSEREKERARLREIRPWRCHNHFYLSQKSYELARINDIDPTQIEDGKYGGI